MCVSLKLQYWRQLKYFGIELFVRVGAYVATRTKKKILMFLITVSMQIKFNFSK
jgi:hypothetical protein